MGLNTIIDNDELIRMEKRHGDLLEEKVAAWRLKSRALWLNYGDKKKHSYLGLCKGKEETKIQFGSLRVQKGR